MSEDRKNPLGAELKDDVLDKVAGGTPVCHPDMPICPECGQANRPVWNSYLQKYVCPNPSCRCPRVLGVL